MLVVGSALSGSMAAYGAMRNGAVVTVIERNAAPHIGGMTISFLNSQTQLEAGLPEVRPRGDGQRHVQPHPISL